jgi:hypothetical protein
MDQMVLSLILERERELSALRDAGPEVQHELAVVHSLLRLIRSGNGQIPIELQRCPAAALQ